MTVVEHEISEYERKRLEQIEANNKVLSVLGIQSKVSHSSPTPSVKVKIEKSKLRKSERISKAKVTPNRYSLRPREDLAVKRTGSIRKRALFDEVYKIPEFPRDQAWTGGNIFGPIPGIPIGTTWEFRMDCGACGVHRSTVGGIHGDKKGCYSIALSGGYEDDIDEGETFTYTGSGGRDLKGTKAKPKNLRTAPQSSDQKFEKGNLSLKISYENKRPIRVIRGFKCPSIYGPTEGYRYDGLYKVTRCWREKGKSGFFVCRFSLQRLPNQPPIPIKKSNK